MMLQTIFALSCVGDISQAIGREFGLPHGLDIRIVSLRDGSYEIVLDFLLSKAQDLFTEENLNLLKNVVQTLGGLFVIRKFMKKDKPILIKEDNNQAIIKNASDSQITINRNTYNIYTRNMVVRDSIDRTFELLNEDEGISDFEIIDEEHRSLIRIPRNEFSRLMSGPDVEEEKRKTEIRTNCKLTIFKLVFAPDQRFKWEFFYEGNRIKANIEDSKFLEGLQKGEKFSMGDVLEADVEIIQAYDVEFDVFYNKAYKIKKVHGHKPRGEQINLDV